MPDHPTTVDHTPAKSPATGSSTIPPTTPTSAVRVARIGGTVAELAAAAISAHTLYHLGGQLDLGPWTAWLLPAALDVYAFTALAVGYSLPAHHPGQRPVLRNARLAFAFTLGCNALDHLLQKAGQLVDPTARDLLLVAVATLPPLVVERLLNLQSLLAGHRATQTARISLEEIEDAHTDRIVGQGVLAHERRPVRVEAGGRPHEDQRSEVPTGHPTLNAPSRPNWTTEAAAVFTDLTGQLGRRPSAREFQQALTTLTKALIAEGRLAAGARPPSITTTKRIRAGLEADPPIQFSRANADVSRPPSPTSKDVRS